MQEKLKKKFPRSLTEKEVLLIQWLLKNGVEKGYEYLGQLNKAMVYSECSCGCASIDLIDEKDMKAGMTILSDYMWKDSDGKTMGIFVFAFGDTLGGMEVVAYEGDGAPPQLPEIGALYPLEKG